MEQSYKKLRPYTDIEACKCKAIGGLFLLDRLTDNPIHCDSCLKEVDPERIGLTGEETDDVAGWFGQARSLYELWLMSGEYEKYAKAKLLDPKGQVNRDGLAIAERLSNKLPTKLWFFHDPDDGEITDCPNCGNRLNREVKWGIGECLLCRLHI